MIPHFNKEVHSWYGLGGEGKMHVLGSRRVQEGGDEKQRIKMRVVLDSSPYVSF